jgi:IS30 family transposase
MLKKNIHHMACEQRCQIQTLLSMKKTQLEIALAIGVNQSSISREIIRNSKGYRYDFKFANEESVQRRSLAGKIPKKMRGALTRSQLFASGLESGTDLRPPQT